MNQRPTRWPWWLNTLPWQHETGLMFFNIHFCKIWVPPPSFFCLWYSLLPSSPLHPFLCFPLLILWNSQLLLSCQVISLETILTALTAPCWPLLQCVATQYVCVCREWDIETCDGHLSLLSGRFTKRTFCLCLRFICSSEVLLFYSVHIKLKCKVTHAHTR